MKFFKIIFYSFLIFFPTFLSATHIIGGYMRYEYLGDDNYEITMYVYRDLNCSNCAFLDDPAQIAIYRYDMLGTLLQGETYLDLEVAVSQQPTLMEIGTCGSNLNVQLGIYKFTAELPYSMEQPRYDIVYQRCCRGENISNITRPDETGFTIKQTIDLSTSNPLINETPRLSNYQIFSVCGGTEFVIDLSHFEAEGDSLIYHLDAPLRGAGRFGTNMNPGNPMLCDGVTPNPPCPGPFQSVRYTGVGVDADNPILGATDLRLDANTGLLTGRVTERGNYLLGYKVLEYRADSLISETQGQFNLQVDVVINTEEIAPEKVQIYPNPVRGELFIKAETLADFQFTVTNLQGQLIDKSQQIHRGQAIIDTTDWQRGVYFVKLQTEMGTIAKKIIVQ